MKVKLLKAFEKLIFDIYMLDKMTIEALTSLRGEFSESFLLEILKKLEI